MYTQSCVTVCARVAMWVFGVGTNTHVCIYAYTRFRTMRIFMYYACMTMWQDTVQSPPSLPNSATTNGVRTILLNNFILHIDSNSTQAQACCSPGDEATNAGRQGTLPPMLLARGQSHQATAGERQASLKSWAAIRCTTHKNAGTRTIAQVRTELLENE